MHTGRFVFSELIAHLPHQEFQKCVARYDDHPQPRKLSYWDQYLAMAFAQLDLPREPAGHRSLPPIRDRETLSPGVSRHGGAKPQVIEFPGDRKSTRLNSSHRCI